MIRAIKAGLRVIKLADSGSSIMSRIDCAMLRDNSIIISRYCSKEVQVLRKINVTRRVTRPARCASHCGTVRQHDIFHPRFTRNPGVVTRFFCAACRAYCLSHCHANCSNFPRPQCVY